MRIRKNARFSSLSLSNQSNPQSFASPIRETLVCQLNQSPWDVMDFSPQSDFSYKMQMEMEIIKDHKSGNSSGGESADASNSVTYSLKKQRGEKDKGLTVFLCNKNDGKGWQCKLEAKEGRLMCEYHLNKLKAYSYKHSHSVRKAKSSKPVVVSLVRKKKNRLPCSRMRGRKRARKESEKEEVSNAIVDQRSSPAYVAHTHDDCGIYDDLDFDTDDNDGNDDNGIKRIRKPIKARSLKSLL